MFLFNTHRYQYSYTAPSSNRSDLPVEVCGAANGDQTVLVSELRKHAYLVVALELHTDGHYFGTEAREQVKSSVARCGRKWIY